MSCFQSGHRARAALIAKNAFTRLDPETHAVEVSYVSWEVDSLLYPKDPGMS